MANGNGRPIMIGTAHELLIQGKPAEALKAHGADGERSKICAILENPGILAEQPPTWAAWAVNLVASAQNEWDDAVKERAKTLSQDVQRCLAAATKRSEDEFENIVLHYSGKVGLIYLDCPLCGEKNVTLHRVDPNTFKVPGLLQHMLAITSCSHALPIPDTLWQVIQNANHLVGKNIQLP